MSGFRVQRLDHVSLNVGNRARSIAWYRDVLGLAPGSVPLQDDWPVFMGEFGACIGLFQASSAVGGARAYESVGLRHVAFMVGKTELERARLHFAESGVEFRFEDHGDSHSVYLTDPDGNVIELTTYEP
jgi:catechol-2,3-dioxygenase